ncbi:hypothetical protein O3P69_017313 [Scylla paramamosain]|uniref:Secreted protein n=1 Tax=Scylla paramamosain TaxID=85552 RepID=A0AAW0TYL6_SCYPA
MLCRGAPHFIPDALAGLCILKDSVSGLCIASCLAVVAAYVLFPAALQEVALVGVASARTREGETRLVHVQQLTTGRVLACTSTCSIPTV